MRIVPRDVWAAGIPADGVPGRIPLPAFEVWLHHGAAGTSTVQTARGYVKYHINKRDYLDVGYSFLIAEGQVLEGRGAGRQGAHTSGRNTVSHGICMVGNYTHNPPSDEDLDALKWLLRHGAKQGWWPTRRLTGGHRDAPGAFTSCPGGALYRLIDGINRAPDPDEETTMTPAQEDKLDAVLQMQKDTYSRLNEIRNDFTKYHFGPLRRGVRALLKDAGIEVEEGP